MYEHFIGRIMGLVILFSVYRISVMAIALSGIVTTLITSLIVIYTSKRFNSYAYKDQIIDVLPIIGLCVFMGIPTYFIQYLGLSNILTLITQVIVGATIYLALSIIFKPRGYILSMEYVRPIINKLRRQEC